MAAPVDPVVAPTPSEPSTAPSVSEPTITTPSKPIHSLVLDTGPLIKNDPPADVLRARAEQLYILPSVLPEIRDAATRTRVETTLLPFVTVRAPKPDSVKVITNFARRTGDLEVMSRPDIEVLALGYELECERNSGDWRLRSTPGQKTLNGKPPGAQEAEKKDESGTAEETQPSQEPSADSTAPTDDTEAKNAEESLEKDVQQLNLEEPSKETSTDTKEEQSEALLADGEKVDEAVVLEEDASDSDDLKDENDDDDDEGGWITPSNLKKHKAKDSNTRASSSANPPKTLQAAVLTSDFAMQNVALRMNLNLVSPALTRISHVRTWVLRCHGCFHITRVMDRQFCPSCGQPTLIRASCTVDDRTGALTVHLKKNFQWNNRGNVYSVPKPVHGSSNGRLPKNRGGKNGWGRDLILSEDQKEYVNAGNEQRRARKKDPMDADFLPGILSGDRGSGAAGGKIRVGAGRNINGRKKR